MTKQTLLVDGTSVAVISRGNEDYISLTDMVRGDENGSSIIENWLRNKNTLEFLAVWEEMYNPAFNSLEFEGIKNAAGLNRFAISVKQWISKTSAVGMQARAGRYGGTFAHRDIAFEFASWISPKFKLYLIREFQRLKNDEARSRSQEWTLSRNLAKINYRIHTDAIREALIPRLLSSRQTSATYASEADVLNVALFGMTARQWQDKNPDLAGNMRDHAAVEQLVVLSNLESINAELIRQGLAQPDRLKALNNTAVSQLKSLLEHPSIKQLK